MLRVGARKSLVINSGELEAGNAAKGLSRGVGPGRGDWRLRLSTSLDIGVLSYVRTLDGDGLLSAMHDLVPLRAQGHGVTLFDARAIPGQSARLRLINPSAAPASVVIRGVDGSGAALAGEVRLSLAAGSSRTVAASELADGSGRGLSGSLGGAGPWSLTVSSDRRLRVMSLLSGPGGSLTNLSSAPGPASGSLSAPGGPVDTVTAAELFVRHISAPVVQSRCVACHASGGASGNTRLVFERASTPGHEALNLARFETFLSEVEGGAALILNKIQGVSHGGGAQVPAGSAAFAQMERFLGRLDAGAAAPAAVTVDTLFDPVRMAPLRKTLRRAALVFAGRVPTEEEYAAIYADPTALRKTIRSLMTGPAFHDFLIRGANDRLLTDRDIVGIFDPFAGFYIDFVNEHYERKKSAVERDDFSSFHRWMDQVQHGALRAPLELIAHVVENDHPYTEILTADYIMANPFTANAYGASTAFDDPEDPREFRPSRITKYFRKGDGYRTEDDDVVQAPRIVVSGPLWTDYPHAGVLNTPSFLRRYPSTATNRNRARARWTHYHFLGVDIENSASRTMDPVALSDTNNPTMHNPACTVCHSVLDPVAGAFQDYGDDGLYKDQWGGMDSLHEFYKNPEEIEIFEIQADSWNTRQTFSITAWLDKYSTLHFRHVNNNYCHDNGECGTLGRDFRLDGIVVRDAESGAPAHDVSWAFLDEHCLHDGRYNRGTGADDHYQWWGWDCAIPLSLPAATNYTIDVVAWADRAGDEPAKLGLAATSYREGDTWYRDMRLPGFGGEVASESGDSLQWLARQIIADPRFAEATVKFWWPSLMGSEVAEPPAEADDADFEGRLLAANAQGAEVQHLAEGFRRGFRPGAPYNLKDLLVEMVLSAWFRADALADADPVRRVALRDAGAWRLLTPEELAHKTAALTGFQWGRHISTDCRGGCAARRHSLDQEFRLLYGGIDSDGITERARDVTSVMAGVAKRHAVRASCPVVMRELFLLPDEDRKLFAGIDRQVTPGFEFGALFEIEAASRQQRETLSLAGPLPEGSSMVRLSFTNDWWGGSSATDRNVHLDRIDLRDASDRVVVSRELGTAGPVDGGGPDGDDFILWGNGSVDVSLEVPTAGRYTVEVVAWAAQAGDELARLDVTVLNATHSGAGAAAIRDKLVELHDKLFGIEVTPHSPDVTSAFRLLVDAMEQGRRSGESSFRWWDCGLWDDQHFFRRHPGRRRGEETG